MVDSIVGKNMPSAYLSAQWGVSGDIAGGVVVRHEDDAGYLESHEHLVFTDQTEEMRHASVVAWDPALAELGKDPRQPAADEIISS